MRAIGRNETKPDPAAGPRQPGLNQFRVVVSGVIQKDVNEPHAGIHGLDRRQQHDRAQGIHRQNIFHDGLTRFQVDGAVNVQAIPPTALFHRYGHVFRRPAANRTDRVGWMHRVREDRRLVSG